MNNQPESLVHRSMRHLEEEHKALQQVIVDLKMLLNQSQERESRLVELLKRAQEKFIEIEMLNIGKDIFEQFAKVQLMALVMERTIEAELNEDKV